MISLIRPLIWGTKILFIIISVGKMHPHDLGQTWTNWPRSCFFLESLMSHRFCLNARVISGVYKGSEKPPACGRIEHMLGMAYGA